MALFTKRRVQFVAVLFVVIFVIFCLVVDLPVQTHNMSRRTEELRQGTLSPSSSITIATLPQNGPLWSEGSNSQRHITLQSIAKVEVKENITKDDSEGRVDDGSKPLRPDVGKSSDESDDSKNNFNVQVNGSKYFQGVENKEKYVTNRSSEFTTTEVASRSKEFEMIIDKLAGSSIDKSNGTFINSDSKAGSSNKTGLSGDHEQTLTVSNLTGLSGNRTGLMSDGSKLSNKSSVSSKTSHGVEQQHDITDYNGAKDDTDKALLATLSSRGKTSLTKEKIEVVNINLSSPSKIRDYIAEIPPPTHLPWNQKQLLVSGKNIYERQWVKELQHFLQHSYNPSFPVTLVSTNQLFVESVINWLIHSLVVLKNPLKNVLVLTMDEDVHGFLKNRSINVICVPTTDNLNIDKPKKLLMMVRVEAARLLVLRMLNHWGVDVINYDNDAIVLKNPQSLLDVLGDYDVVGSTGFMPRDLHDRWGVTLCFGFFLLRATSATKKLWDVICSLDVNDDQKKLNYALSSMQLQWHNHTSSNQFWRGHTLQHNVSVAVFPLNKMCRGILDCHPALIDQYYIWHKGGDHRYSKMVKGSQKVNLWLVKENWKQVSGDGKTAEEWLRSVANLGG